MNKRILYIFMSVLTVQFAWSQSPSPIKSGVNLNSVKIGEAIQYIMEVEVDTASVVVFPEGKTFNPLEIIESFKTDSTRKENRLHLIKKYALTQFDSGHYTIPRQKVTINNQVFFTDSIQVDIKDVVVDTTKQKMYAIKPMVAVESSSDYGWTKWLLIIIGIVAAVIGGFLWWKKKKETNISEEELPPYERAMLMLKKVDESNLLEQDSYKEYYSQVTDAARKYLNEEVYDHAMESTTEELINILNEQQKIGGLTLDKHTIQELKRVLETADLAKFAKTKTDVGTARADRNSIEEIINKTKEAIPEPTEEELLEDEEYQQEVADKKRKRQILIGSSVTIASVVIAIVIWGFIAGFSNVKDTVFGHPTKTLATKEWITSAYGIPPVTIHTPEVLIRNNYQVSDAQNQVLKGNETFVYGDFLKSLFVQVTTQQKDTQKEPVDLAKTVDAVVVQFEQMDGKNITVKDEEYETLSGAKGIKIYGEFEVENKVTNELFKKEYVMLNFAEADGFQQIIVVNDVGDRYAKEVVSRIVNSVELKKVK